MKPRSVSWPTLGDRATFRRRMLLLGTMSVLLIGACVAAAAIARPALLVPILPLAASALLLTLLWTHGAARTTARTREVEQSFAGLSVTHLGSAYTVSPAPILGVYGSRRLAARAALERGGWAIIVKAWDRYYLLAASPAVAASPRTQPVSFRSRAVADVVPAIRDDIALGA